MNKVKLPRKRKKAYIKAKGRASYLGLRLYIEMLIEVGRSNNRFYSYKEATTEKELRRSSVNGLIITKRW